MTNFDLDIPDRALRAITRGTSHVVAFLEPDGTIYYVSPSVRLLFGFEQSEVIGKSILELIHPEDLLTAMSLLAANQDNPADGVHDQDDFARSHEFQVLHRDGHFVTVEAAGNNFLLTPEINGMLVIARDISERRVSDDALRSIAAGDIGLPSLLALIDLVDHSCQEVATALFVREEPPLWVTRSVPPTLQCEMVGHGPWDGGVATSDLILVPDFDEAARSGLLGYSVAQSALAAGFIACWCAPVKRSRGDSTGDGEIQSNPTANAVLGWIVTWSRRHREPLPGYRMALRNATQVAHLALARRRSERRLLHLAHHDALTGVLNRTGFDRLIGSERRDVHERLLIVDLDGFKQINDVLGHFIGDEVLIEIARRIRAALRDGDVLGRFGGDEFAIFLPHATEEEASSIATRIVATFDEAIIHLNDTLKLTASVGIDGVAIGTGLHERLLSADRALYQAKAAGKNCWVVDDPDRTVS